MTTKKSVSKTTANNSNIGFSNGSRKELIPIHINEEHFMVDARTLHARLNVKTKFHTWLERRVMEYGFREDEDYFPVLGRSRNSASQKWEASIGGQNRIDYNLTLDMAKELAMVEKTPLGRLFRKYFINSEKELQSKRLYGQSTTLTEVKKKVSVLNLNGMVVYNYRQLQAFLGYSTKSSLSNVKRLFFNQIAVINRISYVSEEYAKLMILRATVRKQSVQAQKAKSIGLPAGFGTIDMFNARGGAKW